MPNPVNICAKLRQNLVKQVVKYLCPVLSQQALTFFPGLVTMVELDDNPNLVIQYQVMGAPTLLLFNLPALERSH